MLTKIKIKGLFNQFNYEIELKENGLTVLTGPNGYGKTTLLKIIYAFAVKNLFFFFQLPFKTIVLTQETSEVKLAKTEKDTLVFQWDNGEPMSYKYSDIISVLIKETKRGLENSPYESRWGDKRTNRFYTTENLTQQWPELDPEIQVKFQMPTIGDVYLIKEQRLIKNISAIRTHYGFEEMSNTIEEYATELTKTLNDILATASKIGQELDSSFPRRLFEETTQISEKEFNNRYELLKEKQRKLKLYGLAATQADSHPSFKEENAKALFVYLNDTEKKLAVFDDVLRKLEIFTTLLTDRQFAFKQLEISPDFGFKFTTANQAELSLTDLSSGEQQEVVLRYELLFKVRPNTLVLIDEPEISLHVAWQKEVLNDLLKILKLQKIAIIVATHSPQIIGEHWDSVVDLWDLSKGISG